MVGSSGDNSPSGWHWFFMLFAALAVVAIYVAISYWIRGLGMFPPGRGQGIKPPTRVGTFSTLPDSPRGGKALSPIVGRTATKSHPHNSKPHPPWGSLVDVL